MVGVAVSEMIMDNTMVTESVMANCRNKRPTTPPISKMGMKTATREILMERTVGPISAAPRRAASIRFKPRSRRRVMFSSTTMASSTTKPLEIVKAMSDRLSILKPNMYITPQVPIMETGTATVGIKVARTSRRKRKTTMMTRATDIISDRSTS